MPYTICGRDSLAKPLYDLGANRHVNVYIYVCLDVCVCVCMYVCRVLYVVILSMHLCVYLFIDSKNSFSSLA